MELREMAHKTIIYPERDHSPYYKDIHSVPCLCFDKDKEFIHVLRGHFDFCDEFLGWVDKNMIDGWEAHDYPFYNKTVKYWRHIDDPPDVFMEIE